MLEFISLLTLSSLSMVDSAPSSSNRLHRRQNDPLGNDSPFRYLVSQRFSTSAAQDLLNQASFDKTSSPTPLSVVSVFADTKTNQVYQSFIDRANACIVQPSTSALMSFASAANQTFDLISAKMSPNTFVVCGFKDYAPTWCLTTRDGDIKTRHNILLTDKHANLDIDLDHMTFTEDADRRLMLWRPDGANRCISFDQKKGDQQKGYLAIFDPNKDECHGKAGKYKIKLTLSSDGLYQLADTANGGICVGDGHGYDERVLLSTVTNNKKNDDCLNNGELYLQHKIMIPYNSANQPIPFNQLGYVIKNMATVATAHLIALKELYYRTKSQADADKFTNALNNYKTVFAATIGTYAGYVSVMNSTSNVSELQNILNSLSSATVVLSINGASVLSSTSAFYSTSSTSSYSSTTTSSTASTTTTSSTASTTTTSSTTSSSTTTTPTPPPNTNTSPMVAAAGSLF